MEEAKFLALLSQPSPGVVHLWPGSERYLEDTPGNQLQLCRCLYLVCRQTQLTSSHPWRVREGVLLPTLVPAFPSVSGGIIHPSQSMSPPTGPVFVRWARRWKGAVLHFLSFPSPKPSLPASLGSPSRRLSFLPPLPFSFIYPNFSLEHRRSSP